MDLNNLPVLHGTISVGRVLAILGELGYRADSVEGGLILEHYGQKLDFPVISDEPVVIREDLRGETDGIPPRFLEGY